MRDVLTTPIRLCRTGRLSGGRVFVIFDFHTAMAVDRGIEIGLGFLDQTRSELVAQHAAAHFLDLALGKSPSWNGP